MADPKQTTPTSQTPDHAPDDIPLYGGVVDGIQAYRRGDAVVYSVRGGPSEVRQLLDLLERDGVEDVVALISHRPHEEAVVTDAQAENESTD